MATQPFSEEKYDKDDTETAKNMGRPAASREIAGNTGTWPLITMFKTL